MRNKIVAIFTSFLLIFAGAIVNASPASAHNSICDKIMFPPEKIDRTRIAGAVYVQCPRHGHHTHVSLDAWLEVYAPKWTAWGDGDWRRIGQVWEDDDHYTVVAKPNTGMLPTGKYRTRASVGIHGIAGTVWHDIKSRTRYFARPGYPKL